ncbi:MAG: MBL fold metallo-hydrolase [Thermoplasmata archaeon]
MVQLSFYGGVDEIGGNKFLLEDREARIFLDFGRNFAREKRFFDEPWISPRKEEHLLALGILPDLEGLYKADEEHPATIDGVLVSHPHTDHYDAVHWLKEDIPIYASPQARSLILARDFSGRPRGGKEYYLANWTKRAGPEIYRPLTAIEPGKPFEVGGLPVTAYEVDHSIHGAVGYAVESSEGTVVYTGDFRLHGPRGDRTRTFLEEAAKRDPEALLIEGTHVDTCKVESEDEVREKVQRIVEQTQDWSWLASPSQT